MLGVREVGEPNMPMSLYPRLSANRMIIFGRWRRDDDWMELKRDRSSSS